MKTDRRTFCRGALALPVVGGCTGSGQTSDKDIDGVVRKALEVWRVPGASVAVVRADRVEYLRGHGAARAGRAVTEDTVFPLASCSKAFLTACLAMLADAGRLGWDDLVRRHLPSFRLADPLADRVVSLRDLLCHRTGLGTHDLLWYRAAWTPAEAVRRAGLLPLDRPFRSAFQYQSTMFTALGLALSETAGLAWDRFMERRLFAPLGMKLVGCSPQAGERDRRAAGHRLDEQGEVEALAEWVPFPQPNAAGTIHASARDLCGWLRFQLGAGKFAGEQLVSAANLGETHTPQMVIPQDIPERRLHAETNQTSYGMGWVIQDYRGLKMVAHSGIVDGFRVQVTLLPKQKLGLAVLANLHATRMNLALTYSLVDRLLGLDRRDWDAWMQKEVRNIQMAAAAKEAERQGKRQRDTKPARVLAAYAGRYEHPGYGTARVALERGGLVLRYSSFEARLEHFHYDTFVVRHEHLGEALFAFALNAAGEVAEMRAVDWFGVVFGRTRS